MTIDRFKVRINGLYRSIYRLKYNGRVLAAYDTREEVELERARLTKKFEGYL